MVRKAALWLNQPLKIVLRPSVNAKLLTNSSAVTAYGDISCGAPPGPDPTKGGRTPSMLNGGMGIWRDHPNAKT